MKWIQNLTGNYAASASVVDGTLIISLPQAITPVVWRMELGYVRASALEVRNQDNGTFVLTLKTPKGDVHDIAPFDSRGKAVQALMSVSRAMEQAHGQMRAASMVAHMPANTSVSQSATPSASHMGDTAPVHIAAPKHAEAESGKGRFITGVIGTILLLGLIAVLLNAKPEGASNLPNQNPAAGTIANAQTGVPLSADDFLSNR